MTLTHLFPQDYTTSRWSGGETTELLIRPRGALYARRAFLFRVSSATVELAESAFTALPDYDRLIATLEGEIDLVHDGGEKLRLVPYQVHAFDGGSETVSFGRCRDFNLMLRKGKASGSLQPLSVGAAAPCLLAADTQTALLFCASGDCVLSTPSEQITLSAGESLLVEEADGTPLTLTGCPAAWLMLAQMRCL